MRSVGSVENKLQGTTRPFLVNIENESPTKKFVIKFVHDLKNDEVSSKVLFNELISVKIAEKIGLPVLPYEIVKLNSDTISNNEDLSILEAKPGPCFATEYVISGTAVTTARAFSYLKNKDDFAKIILFDQFMLNIDRGNNRGNWLIDKSMKLIAFDYTHIFRGILDWNTTTLEQCKENPPLLMESMNDIEYRNLADNIYKKNAFLEVERNLKNIDFTNIINDIPEEWNITIEEKEAVLDFLKYQQEHVEDIVLSIESYFKIGRRKNHE